MDSEDILILLRQFKIDHADKYHLLSLGIFGSFARGEAREDSDVDVVFETDQPNLFRTAGMQADLQDLLGRPVDVVRLRENMNPRLKARILQDAVYA